MRLFVFLSSISILIALSIGISTKAATTGVVTATVTAQNVSVTVTDGTVAYGTLAVSATTSTTSDGLNDSQTASNDGNVTSDITIRGQNSTNWTLAASIGADQYVQEFCTSTCDTTPTWTALTTSYQALASGVASSGTSVFDLKIIVSSSSTNYTAQSVDITVSIAAV